MLSILGWIPVLGPIIDGIVSIFKSVTDAKVQTHQIDANVEIESNKTASSITLAFLHDIPVRIARDIVMFPGSAWCGLYVYGKIMAVHRPDLVWAVKPLDGPMAYLPYALMTFFFGMSYLNWNRK